MRHARRFWLFALALAAIVILVAACGGGSNDNADNPTPGMDMSNGATMPATTPTTAGQGGTASPGMTGMPGMDNDLMFIDSMIPHHQSAIAMAKVAQQQAERPEIKQLADAIVGAQEREIAQMRQWRQSWFGDAPPSGGMPNMGSMTSMQMTDAELQQLRAAQPFDQAFMQMMIPHHESAIAMAREILKTTQRPEIKQVANDIITSQQQEIDQMKTWLKDWYGQ